MIARASSTTLLALLLLAVPGRGFAEDEVPCPTAVSPRPTPVSARDAHAGARLAAPRAGGFDIVIVPGTNLSGNAAALAAFNRAAEQWEAYISDGITVTINADLASLGLPGPLGQASTPVTALPYTTVRDAVVADAGDEADDAISASLPTLAQLMLLYPAGYSFNGDVILTKPNLLALGLSPGALADPSITFNSDYSFDFDNSNGVGSNSYDFESVAAHEIGHALGFISEVDAVDTQAAGAYYLTVLDFYRFQNDTANDPTNAAEFTTFARGQTPGDEENTDDVDTEHAMSTGVADGDGRQASHWKADELSGTLIGTMDPTISKHTIEPVTNADLRALDLIGYEVGLNPITTSTTTTTTLPPPLCGASPVPSGNCHLVTTPGKSSVQLKDSVDDTKDSFKWTWGGGAATTIGDFEDPANGTPKMQVCLYDASADPQPRLGARFLPGGTCGTKACWKASTKGYSLANKTGVPGEGITKAKYTAGAVNKSKVQLGGKGAALPMPVIPPIGLTLPVTVQLLIDDGVTPQCWQTTYGAASANTSTSFKAKGP